MVYAYKLQTNTKNASNALSAFAGVLPPSGVVKVDDYTVAFHLEAQNGNFPYLTSSGNYNMIIIPNNYNPANWQSSFIGTGPFVLGSYTPKVGATFTRNESYWGTKALPFADPGTGPWNAAHLSNSQYDKLVAQYIAAIDLSTQRSLAGQIETLLLAQTPIIFGYFYNYLTATAMGVSGVYPTAIGHLFLYKAAKS